jgi:hypothetical protein
MTRIIVIVLAPVQRPFEMVRELRTLGDLIRERDKAVAGGVCQKEYVSCGDVILTPSFGNGDAGYGSHHRLLSHLERLVQHAERLHVPILPLAFRVSLL